MKPDVSQDRHKTALTSKEKQFYDALAEQLQDQMDAQKNELRPNQLRSFTRLIEHVRRGILEGLVKQPPAAGKSRYFAEVIAALERPSLVLVPTNALRNQTPIALQEAGIDDERIHLLRPSAGQSSSKILDHFLETMEEQRQAYWVLLSTYASLLSVYKNSPDNFAELMERVDVIISDEAHTALGTKTKKTVNAGGAERTSTDTATQLIIRSLEERREQIAMSIARTLSQPQEIDLRHMYDKVFDCVAQDIAGRCDTKEQGKMAARMNRLLRRQRENILITQDTGDAQTDMLDKMQKGTLNAGDAEQILQKVHAVLMQNTSEQVNRLIRGTDKRHPHLHLRLTATPQLSLKNVQQQYDIPVIDWINIQDLIEDGILVLPRVVSAGKATYRTEDSEVRVTKALLRDLCGDDRFIMEDGRPVMETVTDAYMEERAKAGGYLPAVAFCETIDQAERVRQYMERLGLKAVRCTSGNKKHDKGIPENVAKELLEKLPNDPERVDVVTTVRQVGLGWDVRTLRGALWYTFTYSPAVSLQSNGRIMRSLIEDDPWPMKTTDNTVIIEPEWRVVGKRFSLQHDDEEPGEMGTGKRTERSNPRDELLYAAQNALESMVALGELDLYKVLEKGLIFTRIAFDIRNDDHLRLLIGNAGNLFDQGVPRNLSQMSFSHAGLKWNVSGTRICSQVVGGYSGGEAATMLAHQLWPHDMPNVFPEKQTQGAVRKGEEKQAQPEETQVQDAPNPQAPIVHAEAPAENYKGLLLEHCQKMKYRAPIFSTLKQSGEQHTPVFTVQCTCNHVPQKGSLSAQACATNKKNGEQYAAQRMLEVLQKIAPPASPQPSSIAPTEKPEENYISILNMRWQNDLKAPLKPKGPRFETPKKTGSGQGYTIHCRYREYTGIGSGRDVGIAKQYAAKHLLEQIAATENQKVIDMGALVDTGAKFMQQAQQTPKNALSMYCHQQYGMIPVYETKQVGAELQWRVSIDIPEFGRQEVSGVGPEKKLRNNAFRELLSKLIQLERGRQHPMQPAQNNPDRTPESDNGWSVASESE